MFNSLSDRLQDTLDKLRGKGRLTEDDINVAMREIRMALLEADVNYRVVKDFVATVTERAIGTDVLDSLTPAQQVVKIVNEELTNLMGGGTAKGGIAVRVSHELGLPIYRIGVGEGIDDLQRFDAKEFARALVGEE